MLAEARWQLRRYGSAEAPDRHRRVLAWLIANHLVQGWCRQSGLDVLSFSIGGMYGYGVSIAQHDCRQARRMGADRGVATIACGSVRVDWDKGNAAYHVTERLAAGEDPLEVILGAADFALRGQPPAFAPTRAAPITVTPTSISLSTRSSRPCCSAG